MTYHCVVSRSCVEPVLIYRAPMWRSLPSTFESTQGKETLDWQAVPLRWRGRSEILTTHVSAMPQSIHLEQMTRIFVLMKINSWTKEKQLQHLHPSLTLEIHQFLEVFRICPFTCFIIPEFLRFFLFPPFKISLWLPRRPSLGGTNWWGWGWGRASSSLPEERSCIWLTARRAATVDRITLRTFKGFQSSKNAYRRVLVLVTSVGRFLSRAMSRLFTGSRPDDRVDFDFRPSATGGLRDLLLAMRQLEDLRTHNLSDTARGVKKLKMVYTQHCIDNGIFVQLSISRAVDNEGNHVERVHSMFYCIMPCRKITSCTLRQGLARFPVYSIV